jgi:hypothetical protein
VAEHDARQVHRRRRGLGAEARDPQQRVDGPVGEQAVRIAARVRSGRPESQVNTAFTVDAPSPPPSGKAAARVRWLRVDTIRWMASTISAPWAGNRAVS